MPGSPHSDVTPRELRMMEIGEQRFRTAVGRIILPIAILFLFSLAPPQAGAQTERSLRTWIDTVDQPLCGEGEFDKWGVWFESAGDRDTTIGFRLQDSVLSVELTLRWDPKRVQLLPPYVLDPVSTLLGRFVSKVQGVDTATGELYISASTDQSFRPSVGERIPLFYLKGRVRPTDSTFLPPEGGAKVQRISIEGRLAESISSVRHEPGFVQVTRYTTPEYTGRLEIDDLDLDTLREGTIALYARNFGDRRVTNLSFVLRSDSSKIVIRDVILPATGNPWQELVSVERRDSNTVIVRVGNSNDDPISTIDDTVPLLKVVIARREDSIFGTNVVIEQIAFNETSCLGKVDSGSGRVLGATIDTTKDDPVGVVVRDNHVRITDLAEWIVRQSNGEWIIVDPRIQRVEIYDLTGRVMGRYQSGGSNRVRFEGETPYSGLILAVVSLRDGSRIHVKQYIESI